MCPVPRWIGNILDKGYRLQFYLTPPPFQGGVESKLASEELMSSGGPVEMEWSLHPDIVAQIWHRFGQASVDLFASRENTQCPLWFGRRTNRLSL